MSQDRRTRFIIAWAFAPTEEAAAPRGIAATRQRTARQAGVVYVRDGNGVYAQSLKKVYRDPKPTGKRGRPPLVATPGVGLTQGIKQRVQGRVGGLRVQALGREASACPVCVCEERTNGALRDRLNCLPRKTHAFAKQTHTWDAAVTLCLFERNWLRPHPALRQAQEGLPGGRKYVPQTPAMAVNRADHIWTWKEFLTFQVNQHKIE